MSALVRLVSPALINNGQRRGFSKATRPHDPTTPNPVARPAAHTAGRALLHAPIAAQTGDSVSDHPTSPGPGPAQASTPTRPSTTPALASTPASAVRVARIGGAIAEAAAAAISAHTLYHLGGQLDLGPWTAWLLPAALDVYSFTALAVAYSLPSKHPGQRIVLRTARLAFAMTLGCNALDHFLAKAGRLVDPTVRDLLLVAVATLPPLVVERLLNLQSLLVGHRTTPTVHDTMEQPGLGHDGRPMGQGALAHRPHTAQVEHDRSPHEDQRPMATASHTVVKALSRLDWTTQGAAVFAELSAQLGRRPSAREFQQGLAIQTKTLIAEGRLAAGSRPPSITTAKRVRAALEAISRADSDQSEAEQRGNAATPSKMQPRASRGAAGNDSDDGLAAAGHREH